MNTLFKVKVKYQKIDEHGKQVKVNENYIVEAINFTEAENRIHEIMGQYVNGDIIVHAITRTSIEMVVSTENGQYWYQSKISWEDFDEKSAKTKKVKQVMLFAANSVEHCNTLIENELITMMVPYDVVSVSLSNIIDVFHLLNDE